MNLTIPDAVAEKIKPIAEREHRSITGQIMVWIEAGLALEPAMPPAMTVLIDTRKGRKGGE